MLRKLGALALASFAALACGKGTAPDPRYPARSEGCAVRSYAAEPAMVVDDLGDVEIECNGAPHCGRKLLDEVCKRGGDVVWGLAENPVSSMKMRGHAAHTRTQASSPRGEGCVVQLFADAPPMKTENLGPVTATCSEDTSDDDCTRTLKDQACAMGGDVVWGVTAPKMDGGKKDRK